MNFVTGRRDDVDINLTPLIDVVFLLLIFFMVSTTFEKESELQIQLPEATRETSELPEEPVEVAINASGMYFVDGRELINRDLDTLKAALAERAGGKKEKQLVIRADGRTPHQAVVKAMDAAAQLGLLRLSIATSQALD